MQHWRRLNDQTTAAATANKRQALLSRFNGSIKLSSLIISRSRRRVTLFLSLPPSLSHSLTPLNKCVVIFLTASKQAGTTL